MGFLGSGREKGGSGGGRLLGPSPEAIQLASDKLAMAGHLRSRGVATPETQLIGGRVGAGVGGVAGNPPHPSERLRVSFPCVLKPQRDGSWLPRHFSDPRPD